MAQDRVVSGFQLQILLVQMSESRANLYQFFDHISANFEGMYFVR